MTRDPRLVWRSAALDPDSGLSWRAKLAVAVYCEFANGSGVLDPAPSAQTLADYMGVGLTTVHEARRELEQTGWLTIGRRSGRPSRVRLSSVEPLRDTQGLEHRTPAPTRARGAPELDNEKTSRSLRSLRACAPARVARGARTNERPSEIEQNRKERT